MKLSKPDINTPSEKQHKKIAKIELHGPDNVYIVCKKVLLITIIDIPKINVSNSQESITSTTKLTPEKPVTEEWIKLVCDSEC